jgi:hypothetical protein
MCLISLYPPGVQPELSHLLSGAAINADGSGFSIVMDGWVLTRRSMDGAELAEEFSFARTVYSAGWAAFSSRLATSLRPAMEHVQPFAVGGDTRTVLFHNGRLPFEEDLKARGETRSDSRYLAEELGGETRSADTLTALAGPWNKVAVLSADPGREDIVISSRGQWLVTPQGVLHSNPDYLGKGAGWQEYRDYEILYRWNPFQPGQCRVCHLYGCRFWDSGAYGAVGQVSAAGYRELAARLPEHCEPAQTALPRFRNETKVRAELT